MNTPTKIVVLPGVCYNCDRLRWEREETKYKCCGELKLQGISRYVCKKHDETIEAPERTGCEEYEGE